MSEANWKSAAEELFVDISTLRLKLGMTERELRDLKTEYLEALQMATIYENALERIARLPAQIDPYVAAIARGALNKVNKTDGKSTPAI